MKIALTAALASLAIAVPAQAAAYSWEVRSQSDDGKVTSIIAESDSETGVLLSCNPDKLVVGVGTVPGPMTERLDTSTKRVKTKRATTTIGDKEPLRERWAYLPRTQIAISRASVTGKRFFNAAVRGDTVSVKVDGTDTATFTFPAQNDVFKSFARSCAITNGGK